MSWSEHDRRRRKVRQAAHQLWLSLGKLDEAEERAEAAGVAVSLDAPRRLLEAEAARLRSLLQPGCRKGRGAP